MKKILIALLSTPLAALAQNPQNMFDPAQMQQMMQQMQNMQACMQNKTSTNRKYALWNNVDARWRMN